MYLYLYIYKSKDERRNEEREYEYVLTSCADGGGILVCDESVPLGYVDEGVVDCRVG